MVKQLVSIENFSLFYEEREILKSLNFNIYENEILALVGSSGSGKSLSAQAIMGLLPHYLRQQGVIKWHSKANSIGVILQNPASCFDEVFTIFTHFEETFRAKGIRGSLDTYCELLDEVGLPHWVLEAYPFELSGGMLQRIMVSLALFYEPSLLIADEPTSDLDTQGQKEFLQLLSNLQSKRKFACLLITHDFSLLSIANRVAIMSKGSIVECDSREKIFQNPSSNITKKLINAYNVLRHSKEYFYKKEKPKQQKILLEAKNISVSFKNGGLFCKQTYKNILEDISFCVFSGVNVGIVGKNGAGKSTLVRTLLGLENVNNATIFLNGISLSESKKLYRRQIGIIFQNPPSTLDPRWSAKDAIMEPLLNLGYSKIECENRVREIATSLLLDVGELNRSAASFSGGEAQRIALARAIITKPKLLILDEALSNLDGVLQVEIINLLKSIQKHFELTYMVISHDISVIYELCYEVFELKNQKLIKKDL